MTEILKRLEKARKERDEFNQMPVISITAETCGEGWEKALEAVWVSGVDAEQHYDDKTSKEATVIVNVTNPLKEPRFSKRDHISTAMFLMGKEKKKPYRGKSYVQEMIDGTMDDRVKKGIESYSYHERLFSYGIPQPKHEDHLFDNEKPRMLFYKNQYHGADDAFSTDLGKYDCFGKLHELRGGIDQIANLIAKAKAEPISRKLQAITWQPHKDMYVSGTPCLQRIWIRIIKGKYMVLEAIWRSRDLFKAFGANCVAITELGAWIARSLNLEFTQYVDISNSLHIYASDYSDVEKFFKIAQKRKALEMEDQREIERKQRAGTCSQCGSVRQLTTLKTGRNPEYAYHCANPYCDWGRSHPFNVGNRQRGVKCPHCGAEDCDLMQGEAKNPKALLFCFKCRKTFYWHQIAEET
jgi:thymidylate synthase (methanogen type)